MSYAGMYDCDMYEQGCVSILMDGPDSAASSCALDRVLRCASSGVQMHMDARRDTDRSLKNIG